MLMKEQAIEKISPEITKLIESVIKISDQYGMDRDETIENTAWIILEMMDVASYKNYQLQETDINKKPQTRIEYIRSMSVEELADVILKSEISTTIDFCQNFCGECENIPESECRKCLIKYLSSPVEQKKAIPTNYYKERFNRVQ